MSKLLSLQNPIQENNDDSVELKNIFETYKIIPFYGSTMESNHSFINVLEDLTLLSASHRSCKEDIKRYAFGGHDSFYNYATNKDASDSEIRTFLEILTNFGLDIDELSEFTEMIFDGMSDFGNAFLRVRIIKSKVATKVYLSLVHPDNIAYLETSIAEDDQCIITKKFSEEYWKKNPPEILPINAINGNFNWKEESESGIKTSECIVHIKNKNDKSDYYGRPTITPVINWLYTEWQISDTAVKTNSTEFTAKYLLFFQEVDPARLYVKPESNLNNGGTNASGGVDARMRKLRQLATVEGADPKSIIGMDYPFGSDAPKIEKLQVFRDTNHMKEMVNLATSYIYSVWSWAKELTGFETAKGGIGSNIVFDLFRVKNISTIKPIQKKYSTIMAKVISGIFKHELINSEPLAIQYNNLIEQIIISTNAQPNNTIGNNPIQ